MFIGDLNIKNVKIATRTSFQNFQAIFNIFLKMWIKIFSDLYFCGCIQFFFLVLKIINFSNFLTQ